ncbi:MAG: hypothetical protein JSV77_01085 [Dehalococcoidales bacterium]|nr:MAG: hypothetical protein JSV77_01085 [Dehalococcoidales bacterium]
MRLYHISDQPGIRLFEPRHVPHPSVDVKDDVVWAVDEDHLHNYLLPRDCPRVTFYATEQSDPVDVERLIGPGGARYVIAIESYWLPEIQRQSLYKYELDPASFTVLDEGAGYYISRQEVVPLSETKIDDILMALLEYSVELRITASLWELREAVIHSTLQFSIIRMRNARPPQEGVEAFYPLP